MLGDGQADRVADESYGVAVDDHVNPGEVLDDATGLPVLPDEPSADPVHLPAPLADELLQVHDLEVLVVLEEPHGLVGVESPSYGLHDIHELQGLERVLELDVVVEDDLPLLGIDVDLDAGDVLEGLLDLSLLPDERTDPVGRYSDGSHSSSSSTSSSLPLTVSSMTSAPLFLKNALMLRMSLSRRSFAL